MKTHTLFIIIVFGLCFKGLAQESKVLTLSIDQAESLFLKQNLSLIAQKLNIDMADAAIVQAKLWPNPELSIQQINLWSTDKQRGGEDELIPPLFGSVGKNRQFSVELTQMIQTAGKRRKLINSEKVSKEIATQEFEDLLRSVKFELSQSIQEVIYLQAYYKVLQNQKTALKQLVDAYKKQTDLGNVSKNEYLRLKASLVEQSNTLNETQTELNQQKKAFKTLLNIAPDMDIELTNSTSKGVQAFVDPTTLTLEKLVASAVELRPDVKQARLQTEFFNKSLLYEKAQRIPDFNLHANYDRAGGVWNNYWGFGISFDLPFFNRNQGNIQMARIQIAQSEKQYQLQENTAQHEVVEAFRNYTQAYNFYKELIDDDFSTELDAMFAAYTKNLLNKNISMMEFLDFSEAYQNNQQIILTAYKNVAFHLKELQYNVNGLE